jgi:hypothetical protein
MAVELVTPSSSIIPGIKNIRTVSPTTTVVEFINGGVRRATDLEVTMWSLLTSGQPA